MNIPLRGQNWSKHERGEIGRLEAVCSATDHWRGDRTDAGDPWCIIYDQQDHLERSGSRVVRNVAITRTAARAMSTCPNILFAGFAADTWISKDL